MIAGRPVLLDQLRIRDASYNQGEISELDYLSSQYDIHKTLMDVKKAIVAKANSLSEMPLLANGVVVSAG
jgi:outer membrane protein TolC